MTTKIEMGCIVCASLKLWVSDDEDHTIERVEVSPFWSPSPSDVTQNMSEQDLAYLDELWAEAQK